MKPLLEQVKDEYAQELGFLDFEDMYYTHGHELGELGIDSIALRYAAKLKSQS